MFFKRLSVYFFIGIITTVMLVMIFLDISPFDFIHNNTSTDIPSLLGKNTFTEVNHYASDHFPFRDSWIYVSTQIKKIAGTPIINGVYSVDSRLVEPVSNASRSIQSDNIYTVNTYAERYPNVNTYLMIIPTAAGIYKNMLPLEIDNIDQKQRINSIYSELNSLVKPIDAYTPLYSEMSEQIYYNTDTHWTSFGAYRVYSFAGTVMQYTPVRESSFSIQRVSHDFYGDLYKKTFNNKVTKDRIDLYYTNSGVKIKDVVFHNGINTLSRNSIYFDNAIKESYQYNVFLGNNYPYVKITTENKNGKKLLIFKDSFTNTLVQFLIQNYAEIVLVDLDSYEEVFEKLINTEEFTDVLFAYNIKDFITNTNIRTILK